MVTTRTGRISGAAFCSAGWQAARTASAAAATGQFQFRHAQLL
jgi:hypothetical protein